jgi:hypothetical protein
MPEPRRPLRLRMFDTVNFSIESPAPSASVTAVGGMILVTIDDNGSSDTFNAGVYSFALTSGVGALQSSANFPPHSSTSTLRTVSVNVGTIVTPVTGNNRVIQVDDEGTGNLIGHAFTVLPGSSGSFQRQIQLKVCRPGQLVPVALTLRLDAKVTKGTCAKCAELNRPTLLVYAEDAQPAGTWLSRPIAIAGKSAPPAYWVLQRSSGTAWTLALRQGETVLAKFATTTKAKDCSLPITLKRVGAGSRVCKSWPKTVTISPAR